MFKHLFVILLTLTLPFSAMAQSNRPLNEVSIVALIVTSSGETPVSLSVTHTLESLDAQTLTANAPNASEMRSILKRFTAAAIDTDVALVYYDGAVLKIGDREFVAPGGIQLRRPSDLLTKAIPLSALARATALAVHGGAVLVHSSAQDITLIDGITLVENAPQPRTGTSPILFANSAAALSLADGLKSMADTDGDIDLNDALRGLAALDGVSISQIPTRTAFMRRTTPPAPVVTANPVAQAAEEFEAPDSMALPQVEAESVVDTATVEPAAETAADEPSEMTTGADNTEASTAPVEETTEAPEEVAATQDPELSIDVLRAMQGALTRSHKRTLQRNLRNLGYYRGLIDGIFGRQTERAISAYQESIGAGVTGILTPSQLEALSE